MSASAPFKFMSPLSTQRRKKEVHEFQVSRLSTNNFLGIKSQRSKAVLQHRNRRVYHLLLFCWADKRDVKEGFSIWGHKIFISTTPFTVQLMTSRFSDALVNLSNTRHLKSWLTACLGSTWDKVRQQVKISDLQAQGEILQARCLLEVKIQY